LIKNINKDKRALSPVIATVILISVTIVVAVSVAYWMGSIASGYTSFEQIELPSIYAKVITLPSAGWNITIDLKNTGSAAATVDNIFINSMPLDDYPTEDVTLYGPDGVAVPLSSISVSVGNGNTETIVLQLVQSEDDGFTAGTRIEVKIHTAAGKDYPTSIRLP
jgi:flagellin-like protein